MKKSDEGQIDCHVEAYRERHDRHVAGVFVEGNKCGAYAQVQPQEEHAHAVDPERGNRGTVRGQEVLNHEWAENAKSDDEYWHGERQDLDRSPCEFIDRLGRTEFPEL